LRSGFDAGYDLLLRVEELPRHAGSGGRIGGVLDYGAEGGNARDFGADVAVAVAEVERLGFGEPDVTVDSGALVEPAVAEAGVHADDEIVLLAGVDEVGDVEAEGGVAVVVAADEVAVEEDERVAEGAVELEGEALAGVGCGQVEAAAIPADRGLGIAAAERLVAVAVEGFVVDEGQLDGPVVGEVERAPGGVVEFGGSEGEVAGFGEVALGSAEAQIFRGISPVAEHELPAEVEQQTLAGRDGGRRGRGKQGFQARRGEERQRNAGAQNVAAGEGLHGGS